MAHIAPMLEKEPYLVPFKKRKFLGTRKEQNVLRAKGFVPKGCYNCRYQLSKFYYWRESPCEACLRSPTYYHCFLSVDHVDHWEPLAGNWNSRRNALYWMRILPRHGQHIKLQSFKSSMSIITTSSISASTSRRSLLMGPILHSSAKCIGPTCLRTKRSPWGSENSLPYPQGLQPIQ